MWPNASQRNRSPVVETRNFASLPFFAPLFFIDPNTCIDCGACVPECPYEAIFPQDEVPSAYTMKAGQQLNLLGQGVKTLWTAEGGEQVDFTGDIAWNTAFFATGPGYAAKNM